MKVPVVALLLFFFQINLTMAEEAWHGEWITARDSQSESNTWICFRKDFNMQDTVEKAIAKIAVDSKYWLWINGKQVVFEGGLKRGPNPNDTYYDEVDIAPYLRQGENVVAVLLWYFGKDGFSHNSSGKAALLFDCVAPGIHLVTDGTWKAGLHPAYEHADGEKPNFRLPESNIRFDARKDLGEWYQMGYQDTLRLFIPVVTLGGVPVAPWNRLVRRGIPFWKNHGLKDYQSVVVNEGAELDTFVCKMPYNAQVTPWLAVDSEAGELIEIKTDHYRGGGPQNIRAEYVTKAGAQEYESLGWMNGEYVYYIVPKNIKLHHVKYRETGYDTEFVGSFASDDSFLNTFWKKSARTLYVTMRDNFMDCPDRERAQWWGDLVIQLGQLFYTFDTESHGLARKAIHELVDWQRDDSVLFSPTPAGNWRKELPGQILASVGFYGFWTYYLNTGDIETIRHAYPPVRNYLDIWKLTDDGVLEERKGDWYWGDWGNKIDKQLLYNAWYYLALRGYKEMSIVLGEQEQALLTQQQMDKFKQAFNNNFWDGEGYRTAEYEGDYDDRGQALAVVSGLADEHKYPRLLEIFKNSFLASTYMEKYVLEALYHMGEPAYAMERMKQRFGAMVNDDRYSTLWEGWEIGRSIYGGGTTNHSWSGGGLTLMSQFIAGISPLEPGFKKFQIKPRLADLKVVSAKVETVNGNIAADIKEEEERYTMHVSVPAGTESVVYVPNRYGNLKLDGKPVPKDRFSKTEKDFHVISLVAGTYQIDAFD